MISLFSHLFKRLPKVLIALTFLTLIVFSTPVFSALSKLPLSLVLGAACILLGYQSFKYIQLMKEKYKEITDQNPQNDVLAGSKKETIDKQLFSQLEESLASLQDLNGDIGDVGVTGVSARSIVDVLSEEPKVPNCAIILTDDPSSAFVIPHSSDHTAIAESIHALSPIMKQQPNLKFLKSESDARPKFKKEAPSRLGLSGSGAQIAVDFPINFISYN